MKKPKILIEISGGLITRVTTDVDAQVVIVDYDIDGLTVEEEQEECKDIPQPDGGTSKGIVREDNPLKNDKRLEAIINLTKS